MRRKKKKQIMRNMYENIIIRNDENIQATSSSLFLSLRCNKVQASDNDSCPN